MHRQVSGDNAQISAYDDFQPLGTIGTVVTGLAVLAAALQLFWTRARKHSQAPAHYARVIGVGGLVSGLMTGALAIPGPVALWALLSSGLEPQAIRATLRAFFVVAYGFAWLVHSWLSGPDPEALSASLALSPGVLAGMALGLFARAWISAARLAQLLEVLLFLMGASLILKGIGAFE